MELTQQPGQPIEEHAREFIAQCDALEELWGRLQPLTLVDELTPKQVKAAEGFKAALFLGYVIQDSYETVLNDLHADFLNGINNYPATVEAAVTLLKRRRDVKRQGRDRNWNRSRSRGNNRSAMFAQTEVSDDEENRSEDEHEAQRSESTARPREVPAQSIMPASMRRSGRNPFQVDGGGGD